MEPASLRCSVTISGNLTATGTALAYSTCLSSSGNDGGNWILPANQRLSVYILCR